jgi:hypothetical protein
MFLEYYRKHPEDIPRRLKQLDDEWDIARAMETNASLLALLGLMMAVIGSPMWRILSFVVLTFLFQHSIQGWCPPVPVFRNIGFRTQTEINQERFALKYIRGDFQHLDPEIEETHASTKSDMPNILQQQDPLKPSTNSESPFTDKLLEAVSC